MKPKLLHLLRCLLCLVLPVPSHRSSTPPLPEAGRPDSLRRLLLADALPSQA